MSKLKRNVIIFTIVVIVLFIVAFLNIIQSKRQQAVTDRVLGIYQKITQNQNFTFSMEETTENTQYKVSMSQSGENFIIDMDVEGEHTSTLVLGNQIYYIMHNEEEYYTLEDDDEYIDLESDIYILESGLKEITKKEYVSGSEEINGKTYYYEEYDNDSLDFILFADTNETSKAKIRFYFDGENLVYIKNIITSEEQHSEELINVSLKYESDENLFKIPEDYAEVKD